MSTVLAAVNGSPTASLVLQAAKIMAATIGGGARAVHVREGDSRSSEVAADALGVPIDVRSGDPIEGILAAAGAPDVAVVVIGARSRPADGRPTGHVALAVVTGLARPVLVLTPDARLPPSGRFGRVLAPLEGTRSSTDAVTPTLRDLSACGCSIVAVHVFQPATAPRFWDQPGHAGETWGSEFLGQWFAEPAVDLHLRAGDVPGAIFDVARDQGVDLIAVGWSRHLNHHRAAVVRAMLERSPLPVLLMPVDPAGLDAEGPIDPGAGHAADEGWQR